MDLKDKHVTVIRGKIYDITNFINTHPGGRHMVSIASGRDATMLFEGYHLDFEKAEKTLKSLPVIKDRTVQSLVDDPNVAYQEPPIHAFTLLKGEKNDTINEFEANPNDSALFKRIRERMFKEVLNKRDIGARGNLLTNSFTVLMTWTLCYMLYLRQPSWWMSMIMGFCTVFVGIGLQHTANHGALTIYGRFNSFIGWTDDILVGGSAVVWRYHHNLSHHIYCNLAHLDQDVASSFPLMRFSIQQPLEWYHKFQFIYGPMIFSLLYFSVQVQDWSCLLSKETFGIKMYGLSDKDHIMSFVAKILHYFVVFVIPMWYHGFWCAFGNFLIWTMWGSVVLSTTFIVSHNLADIKPDAIDPALQKDWAKWQIATSASWGGAWAVFFTGGLNMQIEHHLFPGLSHNLYTPASKIVKEECAKLDDVKYAEYGDLFSITWDMLNFLYEMGYREVPKYVPTSKVDDQPKKQIKQ